MLLYRRTRERVRELLTDVRRAGYDHVSIQVEGDIADICRLTCMEQGIAIAEGDGYPRLEMRGMKVVLNLNQKEHTEVEYA